MLDGIWYNITRRIKQGANIENNIELNYASTTSSTTKMHSENTMKHLMAHAFHLRFGGEIEILLVHFPVNAHVSCRRFLLGKKRKEIETFHLNGIKCGMLKEKLAQIRCKIYSMHMI